MATRLLFVFCIYLSVLALGSCGQKTERRQGLLHLVQELSQAEQIKLSEAIVEDTTHLAIRLAYSSQVDKNVYPAKKTSSKIAFESWKYLNQNGHYVYKGLIIIYEEDNKSQRFIFSNDRLKSLARKEEVGEVCLTVQDYASAAEA